MVGRSPFSTLLRDVRALFALTVLAPGLLLGVFGVRAYIQERRLGAQQARDILTRAARAAASDIEAELREWQGALNHTLPDRDDFAAVLSSALGAALSQPGGGLLIIRGEGQLRVWPEAQLLYRPASVADDPAPPMLSAAVAAAERIEIRDKNYARAIVAYERLLAGARGDERIDVLHRLARTYRKAGREADARAAFAQLAGSATLIGALPADFVAAFETQSTTLYRDLVDGRWLLDQPRYAFYSAAARQRIASVPPSGEVESETADKESKKRRLTDAVEVAANGGRPTGYVSWPRMAGPRSPRVQTLIATDWLTARAWAKIAPPLTREGIDINVLDEFGQVLYRTGDSAAAAATTMLVTADFEGAAPGWRVQAWPRDGRAFTASFERRQSFLLITLVMVVGLLGFGGYTTMRTVRKEIEIARLKSDFVSTVSHEFRSPLTAIRQFGELLARGRVPGEARRREYYARITDESERLGRLVDNLLDFARMEDGRRQYSFEPIDPGSWLRAVVSDSETRYATRGVAIRTDIAPDLPPIIADRMALACAVQNLLDNAVNYSPGRDTVWVEADARDRRVTIRVRDEGVGIGDADRGRVFEKFYRGRSPITDEVKGAGLGLSLVQHIVAAHGGVVDCKSRPGLGSTFAIHLNAAT